MRSGHIDHHRGVDLAAVGQGDTQDTVAAVADVDDLGARMPGDLEQLGIITEELVQSVDERKSRLGGFDQTSM